MHQHGEAAARLAVIAPVGECGAVPRREDGDRRLRLPMLPGSRSMNLSNAVSVVVFEAWRQQGFDGAQ